MNFTIKMESVRVGRVRGTLLLGENCREFILSGDQLLRGTSYNATRIAHRLNQVLPKKQL